MTQHKHASLIIALRDDQILCIPRKTNPNDFGFPGGKVDEAEDHYDAAHRELLEETGHVSGYLQYISEKHDGDYVCHLFLTTQARKIDTHDGEPGWCWMPIDEFLERSITYKQFNNEVIKLLTMSGFVQFAPRLQDPNY